MAFFCLIKPKQIKSEIRNLLNIIRKKKPQFLLEIGTAQGGTLFFFSRLAAENAVLISVDLPGGKYGGGYPIMKIPLYESFTLPKQKIYLIRANSHDSDTLCQVKAILKGNKLEQGDLNQMVIRTAENGHLEVVKYLVSVGADIHSDEDDALVLASGKGHLEVVK